MLFALYSETTKQADGFMSKTEVETVKMGVSSNINSLWHLIFFIIVFAGIIALAYYSTKYLAKYKMQTMAGKNISVIETMSLGIGLALYLVKTGEQYFLISVTKEKINLISEIQADSIKEFKQEEAPHFDKIMKDYLSKFGQSKK